MISPVAGFIGGAFQTIGDTVRTIFGGIGDFIGGVFRNIVGVIRGPINTVIGFLNQAIDGANVVGGAFGVKIGHIPMLATGGTITGSGSVIVGERGPELLNLPTGASVVPLDGSVSVAGGKGDTVNNYDITINEATDPLGVEGRIAASLRKFKG
ncbi:MAG: hypothetical protein J0I33_05835 [Microbacterium ginsengisoli]|uniref:hypothetical protein n=1 Tax=Microbacterium TaxID=33882 RepID=UPI0006FE19DB|nr:MULTISPECIES: hypothetical protein [unclassified Microbacterium]MBN9198143.1 hypothetical protein [Microbacterium ginsengisoli]KQR90772.1 hypothetical protein ASG00_07210 [Microbacterium sp. Leaf351]KQR96984.1 hypothetical protein ASF93_03265 [Microbacterium sp. Leaf347]ODU76528.1 MAG: hypothetical protein ABT08_09055 [Microbacterium sp. SCN 71-21]OJU78475.1 MAG: hypothetical protein BGO15_13105 [Microbacterium sp. 71-23]